MFRSCLTLLLSFYIGAVCAQSSTRPDAIEIYHQIEKLNFLGSALYIAAHPDDENTRLIAYLSKELNARTAYLSLTRGDGGQNLLGTEIREQLGVIRTHELLQARSIDGGQQFFTRANDFGYSKHPDETFAIWNKEEVLSDVVWVIRKFQPDIIVNRFDHRTPGKTHGHHTGSAVLSLEAFSKAADASSYPSQLQHLKPWSTNRIFMNTSWWFYGSRENFAKADKTNLLSVDIGKFDPMLGASISEIATRARSQHLSQGFGAVPSRGSQQEWLEFLDGSKPDSKEDLFEGINTSWTRLEGGAEIGEIIDEVIANYDFKDPGKSVAQLLEARRLILKLEDSNWKDIKSKEIDLIIESACGLYLEAVADQHMVTQGDSLEITIEATNRSDFDMTINAYKIHPFNQRKPIRVELENNIENKWYESVQINQFTKASTPYWLEETGTLGMYKVEDQLMRGLPETPVPINVLFDLNINGHYFKIKKDIVYKYRDPAVGEVYKPFEVTPAAFVSLQKDNYIFADNESQEIDVQLKAGTKNISGKLMLDVPNDWKVEPKHYDVDMTQKSEKATFSFKLTPSQKVTQGIIKPIFKSGLKSYSQSLQEVEYAHIPYQSILMPAERKVVSMSLKKGVDKIGYIMGAGDKVPESLISVGYNLEVIELEDVNTTDLSQYDAILLGIRIYNTKAGIILAQDKLFDYVKAGGTLITQYNTTRSLKTDKLAPYELKLSRDRVADEYAEVTILNPSHRVLNFPNKITDEDFDNWVQERGLYFPDEWGPEFETILSCHDKGEDAKTGGLLIAKYGEGNFVYSGYSWFRELPAGVTGAYRLFANIIALSVPNE